MFEVNERCPTLCFSINSFEDEIVKKKNHLYWQNLFLFKILIKFFYLFYSFFFT